MGNQCCKEEAIDFQGQAANLRHFYLLRVIGKGAFGKVRIIQHKQSRKEYALKYISKSKCVQLKVAHNVISERRLLEHIHHPLIVNLRYAFQDDEHVFMALDLMLGGDLRFHFDRLGVFTEHQVRFFVADIALALIYLGEQRIGHRDIKPDNILLDSKGHAHLTDFNIGTRFDSQRPMRWSRVGSLAYMAPEILNGSGYDTTVDWWSLGITAYELLFGKRPYRGINSEALSNAIMEDPLCLPVDASARFSPECLQVIQGLLTKSPIDRLGCGPAGPRKFLQHAWFAGIDWRGLETKTAVSPFIPNSQESNFDAVHALEELLLEEVPLRPTKYTPKVHRSSGVSDVPLTLDESELNLMDEKFLPFDYTKLQLPEINIENIINNKNNYYNNSIKNGDNDNDNDNDNENDDGYDGYDDSFNNTTFHSFNTFNTSNTSNIDINNLNHNTQTKNTCINHISNHINQSILLQPLLQSQSQSQSQQKPQDKGLFHRMGQINQHFDQSRYRSQGYELTPNGFQDQTLSAL
ncbi:kinase-like domain-containing protein [Phycomyces blakesleeanus]|uniref:Kinase-like domain-containing protein n=1 Tax=Phycomyces blakesleeanus TaxID=4837 RepID=A0ABR3AN98_PHYBL